MRLQRFIPLVLVAVLALGALAFWYRSPAVAPTVEHGYDVDGSPIGDRVVEDTGQVLGPEEPQNEPPETAMEETIAPTVRDFPPPSGNLTGATLGNQRVEAMQEVGDVFQMYFHYPSFTLFMAVIERDGLRSIWRLDQYGRVERVFAANTGRGEIRIFGDSKGVMYVQYNNPIGMVRTDDQFKTWHEVHGVEGLFWDMADDGHGTVWGTLHDYNSALLFHSPDDGFSWEPLVDFQEVFPEDAVRYSKDDPRFRLRHLHSVIYNDKADELIVGTGDVARYTLSSRDRGKTWAKIWYEGFTAHVAVGGGSRYLFCPDKLRGPGIALYDAWKETIEDVFDPGVQGFAGYCYSMANVDGIYYAAFHTESNEVAEIVPKSGIVVSPDATTWYPFLEWGPLGHHARTDIWLEPSPGALFASVNGALYEFSPLDNEWFTFRDPFAGE